MTASADNLTGVELRRELELAGDAASQAAADLRQRMRESHIGDDWMYEGGAQA